MKLCHPGKACTNPWFANHYTCFLNSSISPKDQILLDNQSHAQETARTLAEEESGISKIYAADQASIVLGTASNKPQKV